MSNPEFIDLCSDEENDASEEADVKPILLSKVAPDSTKHGTAGNQAKGGTYPIKHEYEENRGANLVNGVPRSFDKTNEASSFTAGFSPRSGISGSSIPICRQFWKSGDYEVRRAVGPISHGPGRLRIHPKFLHSNATSHKWAFGAIAELLDNAVDEVQKGATAVIVDKFTNPRNGDPALLIQDNGSGMNPESLRCCMSFGFSDKQSDSSIGQYGNGFKTSTMRLGADVIVFSRCMNKRVLTQSVGLLSYTFLRQTGCDDVVVPMVDYELNPLTGACTKLVHHGEKQFLANLSALLKWSPFSGEVELLNQFNDMDHHGTKIIVFNLWFNDDAGMELDFESDPKDIMINSADRHVTKKSIEHILSHKYVANRLHFSLREYLSVLYLRLPENFKIILRGQVVKHHHIANDLKYRECIKYRPQVGGIAEPEVFTTIGYLKGAPNVNVHGINVYHRNRLILPFWRVAHNSYGKGRGVVGVLEANFIKPTHDKQDFEKSILFQKLETRLKEMTYEYWDLHCHLVGYTKSKNPSAKYPASAPTNQTPYLRTSNGKQVQMTHGASQALVGQPSCLQVGSQSMISLNDRAYSTPGLLQKRKYESSQTAEMEQKEMQMVAGSIADGSRSNNETQLDCHIVKKRKQEAVMLTRENKKLRDQCSEYEKAETELMIKAEKLRAELVAVEVAHKNTMEEIELMRNVKMEKL